MNPFSKRLCNAIAWVASVTNLVAPMAAIANTVVCVPADMTLGAALNQAQSSATTIHLSQGTHDLAGTVWHRGVPNGTLIRGGSQLIGGYTAGCTSRDIAAGNTKLIDTVFSADASDGTLVKGDLTIEGITFALQNGFILNVQNFSGGVVFNSGGTILLSRDAFLNTGGNYFFLPWAQASGVDGTIRVVDSLFANNLVNACFIDIAVAAGGPNVDFVNNTVVDNSGTGSAACFTNHYGGSGSAAFRLYNNIFYGTTGVGSADLYVDTNLSKLVDNFIGNANYAGGAPGSISGTQNGDPKLDANYRPIEAPPSQVINSGDNNPPDGLPSSDLDGGTRQIGAKVDRGAYESGVDSGPIQTVKNTNDTGPDSLRAAVGGVILNGGGTIQFDIGSGCGPHVITLESDLQLTVDATIDGYSITQTGASPNDLDVGDDASICVILEADPLAGSPPGRGIVVPSSGTNGVSVTIQGLGFSNFSTAGIDLQGGSGHTVAGDHFGGNIGGHTMLANGYNVRLGAGTHDNAIGGSDNAGRNIIGGATNSGIVIDSGSTGNQLINNYVGLGWGATYINRGNGARGIYLAGDNTTITGNRIGFNAQAGIVLDSGGAHDNLISQNFIGSDGLGANFGNTGAGIHLIGAVGDAPENNTIRENIIMDNNAQGVFVDVGQGNRIRKNSIDGNAALGIDLDAIGPAYPQSDDATQTPDLANRGQNFPLLTAASGDSALGTVVGTLTTTPGDYTVDFYLSSSCDGSTYGQGAAWLGGFTVTVPTPGSGDQGDGPISLQIDALPPLTFADGNQITATATDSLGNTSEFSPCARYSNDGIFFNGFEPAG